MNIPLNAAKIDLSNMGLTEIPAEIFRCKNLRKLNLSHNQIKVIPQELSALKLLKNLDLSHNAITTLLSRNFAFRNLEVLILNHNKIRSIPKQVGMQVTLKNISLAYNQLASLPGEFSQLKKLKSLNLAHNHFQQFPRGILDLTDLTELWLNGNNFEDFPTFEMKESLKALKKLYCFNALTGSTHNVHPDFQHLQNARGNSIAELRLLALKYGHATAIKKSSTNNTRRKMLDKSKFIFISYCHTDKKWLAKIQTALKTLQFEGLQFVLWDDTKLVAGNKWKEEIDKAIQNASVAIMLVSNDFLASGFIRENELPPLLQKAEEKGTTILPVIVGKCRFTKSQLAIFQAVNDPQKPLNAITEGEQDSVYYDLAERIDAIFGA